MSTDHNEPKEGCNAFSEQLEEESVKSSPPKKFDGNSNVHAKPKRRNRRGKKRKQRACSGASCGAEHREECESHNFSWDSEEEDIEVEDYHLFSDVVIRPTDVPKAPENSTQFIIDDHDECRLYMSFETPLFNYVDEIVEPDGEDAAYVDINYEYESPLDFDNTAYYDREFELSYKNSRFDDLWRMDRTELITNLQDLENNLKELNDDLVKEDPDPMLERLQTQLLELQEKHSILQEENNSLQNCLQESGICHQIVAGESKAVKMEGSYETLEDYSVEGKKEEQYSGATCVEQTSEQSLFVSHDQKKEETSHIIHVDASNKENDCYEEEHLQSRCKDKCHVGGIDSCIPAKEKVVLRDSEYHESCEDMPLNSVSEEHELSAVTV